MIEIEVGLLLVGKIEAFFKKLEFYGYEINVLKSKGFLSSEYTIKADKEVLDIIQQSLQNYIKD